MDPEGKQFVRLYVSPSMQRREECDLLECENYLHS